MPVPEFSGPRLIDHGDRSEMMKRGEVTIAFHEAIVKCPIVPA